MVHVVPEIAGGNTLNVAHLPHLIKIIGIQGRDGSTMRNPPLMSRAILSGSRPFESVRREVAEPDARVLVLLFCLVGSVARPPQSHALAIPDALGTSRVLSINPAISPASALCNMRERCRSNDHEVVITFDDGPIPPYTNAVLDTLASQCVKATYFLVGEMARAYPPSSAVSTTPGIRSALTVKTTLRFSATETAKSERQVEPVLQSVRRGTRRSESVPPFFRIPGLGQNECNRELPCVQIIGDLERGRCRR